jgi:hypothetical protein
VGHRRYSLIGRYVERLDGYNQRQPSGHRVFPFGFLPSLQAKSRMEMAKKEPGALFHELWRRREPRPAAPYFKQPKEAKDHAFDRERGGAPFWHPG